VGSSFKIKSEVRGGGARTREVKFGTVKKKKRGREENSMKTRKLSEKIELYLSRLLMGGGESVGRGGGLPSIESCSGGRGRNGLRGGTLLHLSHSIVVRSAGSCGLGGVGCWGKPPAVGAEAGEMGS